MSATRHIIPISGKDSLATAIVQQAVEPDNKYEFVYNDTRMELPETYEWISLVEKTLGITIVRCGKSLVDVIQEQGMIPSPKMRFCTKYSKIFPMREYIGKDDAVLYIGLRADEHRAGAQETKNMAVRYPLRERAVNLKDVYAIVGSKNLMPPCFFWKRVHDSVVGELGDFAHLISELPKWVFDRAFAWRSRPNCFMCFYQRRYEWAGLLEHHPELFGRAEQMERSDWFVLEQYGEPFNWISAELPLSLLRERAEEIISKRVQAICKMLRKKLQKELWSDTLLDELDMAQTSCGMFCGK